MRLKLVPNETNIRFLKYRLVAAAFSAILMIGSIVAFGTIGLNKGIDFEGGLLLEYSTVEDADMAQFRSVLGSLNMGDVVVQTFGAPNDVLIRIERQPGNEELGITDAEAQQIAVVLVRDTLETEIEDVTFRRSGSVSPKVSGELVQSGVMAVTFAVLAVLLYIWFRFEWHFGVGAVVALVHDVVLTIGFFAVTGLEFNLSIIAAILTIVGYSLNDTVVVYDRVREKLRKFRSMPLEDLLNLSLNKTLQRTLMTSITTLIALFSLFIFGGEVISGFTAAMIWGVFVGTYSSVFIAAPVLLYLDLPRGSDED
ncbi:MAG: protein translocase subunit SecF [Sphingomonadales bacterium]|nr:protein translocase subunit SecF [Sphingomonadales bacterium]